MASTAVPQDALGWARKSARLAAIMLMIEASQLQMVPPV
jgi:hypothetical protein